MQLQFEMTPEDVVVNRIKSKMRTLDNYRRTSMTAHNRLMPAVRIYASAAGKEVRKLADENLDMPQVQRWAAKFDLYLQQYGLVTEV